MDNFKGYEQRNTSLIEEDTKNKVNTLQRTYLQLNKGIEALSIIDTMQLNEFKYHKSDFLSKNEEVEKLIENINHLIKTLQTTEIKSEDFKKKANSVINKVNSQLNNRITEYKRIRQSIESRQKHFLSDDINEVGLMNSSFESQILFKDYSDSKEVQDRKTLELEHIKQTSAQVASLSGEIKFNVDEQGKAMKSIADNVERVNLNVCMGEKEIRQIEKVKHSQNRKIAYMIIACLLLLMFVIYLFTKIFF